MRVTRSTTVQLRETKANPDLDPPFATLQCGSHLYSLCARPIFTDCEHGAPIKTVTAPLTSQRATGAVFRAAPTEVVGVVAVAGTTHS